jgi:hypothetical protein
MRLLVAARATVGMLTVPTRHVRAVLGRLQSFLPELAAANETLGDLGDDGSGFELERLEEAEEVLTHDAQAALTAADIAESSKESDASANAAGGEAGEADGPAAAPQIHMDLYCGVLEEKQEQDASSVADMATSGILRLPGGGVLAPRSAQEEAAAAAAAADSTSDEEVVITTRSMLSSDSDSDSDSDSEDSAGAGGENSGSKGARQRRDKLLVQEVASLVRHGGGSSGLIPGLPDPTDRELVDECVSHEEYERDCMQHVEEVVRWHRQRQGGQDHSGCKCVEITEASGADGAYKLRLTMSSPAVESQSAKARLQKVAVETRRTADGGLKVTPVPE